MFSSQAPFNNDPEPWAIRHWDSAERPRSDHPDFNAPEWFDRENSADFLPRIEYTIEKHNPTNRVLTHIRKHWDGLGLNTRTHLVNIHLNLIRAAREGHEGESWERYTEDTLQQMDHAERVLVRLKTLYKEMKTTS